VFSYLTGLKDQKELLFTHSGQLKQTTKVAVSYNQVISSSQLWTMLFAL